jgi:acetyl-CoA carboxylase biotin carboxyl carrier protein
MDLTNEDVTDILALLDSLPYDELDLQTSRFRLILRRTPDGWTQSTESRAEPVPVGGDGARDTPPPSIGAGATLAPMGDGARATQAPSIGGRATPAPTGGGEPGLVPVRAPLPGTFYRAPRPGAEPFVEVGSRVGADSVVGIVETMKLMNSVTAGVDGTVAEICLGNAEFAANGATLLRIRVD